jgi:hypothetical protein
MATASKGFIAKNDLKCWDGVTNTFTRKTSSGGTSSYDVIDWVGVDVYRVYGARTRAVLQTAVDTVGSTNLVTLFLSPGAWTIDDDITFTSNVTLKCLSGVTVTVASGKTLTIEGALEAGPYQIFAGTGTVTISGIQIIHDQWADGSGDAYFPSVDNKIDLGKSTLEFKDIYSDGTIYADDISIAADIIPETDNTSDLGSSSKEFKDAYIDGTIYADTIDADAIDDADYITVAIRDASGQIIHEVPLSQAFSSQSGWF